MSAWGSKRTGCWHHAATELAAIGLTALAGAMTPSGCAPVQPAAAQPSEVTVSESPRARGAYSRADTPPVGAPSVNSETSSRAGLGHSIPAPDDTSPPAPTLRADSPPAEFIWPGTRLDQRPASHLAAGKRRIAAIVTDGDNKRRLVVFALPEPEAGNPPQPVTSASAAIEPRVDVALPTSLETTANASVMLFMGRDDWPRIIVAPAPRAGAVTYHRYRPGEGWKSPTDEQGALAARGRGAGYYGVLGHVDPEVLCVPETECYEKRTSGWVKRAVPGSGIFRVVLTTRAPETSAPTAWAWSVHGSDNQLLQLNGDWVETVPALPAPFTALDWWGGAGSLAALTTTGLYRYAPRTSPPRSDASSSLGWILVATLRHGNALCAGPSDELLVGTSNGLFRIVGPNGPVQPVTLEVNGSHAKTGNVRAIEATVDPKPRYVVAGDAGVLLLDVEPTPAAP